MKIHTYVLACLLLSACGKPAATNSDPASPKTEAPAKVGREETEHDPKNHSKGKQNTGRYAKGDKLYCYAKSGLVLRDEPAQSGNKQASVAMYEQVEVIDDAPFETAFETKESCGLAIPGHWVQVRHTGKAGWLFDGYLLPWEPKEEISDIDYWDKHGKVTKSDQKIPAGADGMVEYNAVDWDNGVRFVIKGYEGGADNISVLPKELFTFEQAYLFAIAEDPKNEYAQTWKCTCKSGTKKIECSNKEGYGLITLLMDKQGNTEITESWAD
jgi:hypothetical protein